MATDAATSTLTLETPLGALTLSGDALCAAQGAAPTPFTQHPCPAAPGHCLLSCAGGYLALGPAPKLALGLCALPENATPLRLAPARLAWGAACAAVAARLAEAPQPPQALALPPPPPFALSPQDLAHFAEQGYVVVRESAARASVECALRAINSELGQGNLFAAAPAGAATAGTTPPQPLAGGNHSSHPALLALLASSRAGAAVAQLLGPARAPAAPPKQCQVAPRFPQPLPPRAALAALAAAPSAGLAGTLPEEDRAQARRGRGAWHIDGTGKGAAYPFSLLVGAFLTDTQGEGEGQLTVFPGSHLALAARLAAPGGEAALYGEEAKGGAGARCSLPEACRPLQLRVRAGDAVIAHPLLAHRVGVNYSAHVRHAVFFRVKGRGVSDRAALVAGALFGELEGLPLPIAAAAAAAAAAQ